MATPVISRSFEATRDLANSALAVARCNLMGDFQLNYANAARLVGAPESERSIGPESLGRGRTIPSDHKVPGGANSRITRSRWEHGYGRRLIVTDFLVILSGTALGNFARFGSDDPRAGLGSSSLSYFFIGAVLVLAWMGALSVFQTRDPRLFGNGVAEYQRVARTGMVMFGWVAIFALLSKFDPSRGYLAIVFPVVTIGLIVNRRVWRAGLRRHRAAGRCNTRVLVIGGERSAKEMAAEFERTPTSGYVVSGVWIPDERVGSDRWIETDGRRSPVHGVERELGEVLALVDADTVAVTDTHHIGSQGMRDLAWELHDRDVDLMVVPSVVDVAGPRMHMSAVANMPLIHLEAPKYEGAQRFGKSVFDRTVALLVLIGASPLMVAAAIAVVLTSPGPVFYKHERIGRGGKPFGVYKLRSMFRDADARFDDLLAAQGPRNTPLFKIIGDPRITPVGRFIRRFSIDELPQLFNVLKGEMSLVGPRPQVAAEVALYDHQAVRRLNVRPGITGLWQVHGRSDLSWEESLRFDLDYVENWSMVRDLQIMWKTLGAVVAARGAY